MILQAPAPTHQRYVPDDYTSVADWMEWLMRHLTAGEWRALEWLTDHDQRASEHVVWLRWQVEMGLLSVGVNEGVT